ncbi:MAG: DNA-3-methyladenine glycosylase 2 family protein [Candidatus Zixiibacteriota bacterium]
MRQLKSLNGPEVWKDAVGHLRRKDTTLANAIKLVGPCTLGKSVGGFETLARTIISQQLSLEAAGAIFGRIKLIAGAAKLTPPRLAKVTDEQLREAGASWNKVAYLRDLCSKVSAREISFHNFHRMSDDEVRTALTSVKGLGVWSADMYLIFVMNRADILPTKDQGLMNGISMLYDCDVKKIDWESHRARWTPYCSVASWYLWAYKNRMIESKTR